jgi:hypothetical protein
MNLPGPIPAIALTQFSQCPNKSSNPFVMVSNGGALTWLSFVNAGPPPNFRRPEAMFLRCERMYPLAMHTRRRVDHKVPS